MEGNIGEPDPITSDVKPTGQVESYVLQAGGKLEDMKKNPPNHPEYEAPKGGARKVNHPRGKGWLDKKKRVWIPTDHNGTEAPHYDRQDPRGGGYKRIFPIEMPAADPSLRDQIGQMVGLTGTALTIYLIFSEGSRLFPPRNLVPIP